MRTNVVIAAIWLSLVTAWSSARAETCPINDSTSVGESFDRRSNCSCPAGYQREQRILELRGADIKYDYCRKLAGNTNKSRGSCRLMAAIAENLAWFHKDQPHHGIRNRILSALNASDADEIRSLYKRGQNHNANAQAMIDFCDDDVVLEMANSFAEYVVRVKRCGDQQPAPSANCSDLKENLRWALLENDRCSLVARTAILRALRSEILTDEQRAANIRSGFKSAQWHRPDVHDSIDFLSDSIVISTARNVIRQYEVKLNSGKMGDEVNCRPRPYKS